MAKKQRKLSKSEAFKIMRPVKEGVKAVRFVKLEDAEEGQVYGVVTPTAGDATVTFKDGDLMVGPFATPDEARAAMGDDVVLVQGEPGDGGVSPMPAEGGEEVLIDQGMNESGKKVKSNLMRMRRNVVENLHKKVLADIKAESQALDVDTDVKQGDGTTQDAAGALDMAAAPGANAEDLGPNALKGVKTDQDPAADDSDHNLIECRAGQLVKVVDIGTGEGVDRGVVSESTKDGFKLEGSDELYPAGKYQAQILATS